MVVPLARRWLWVVAAAALALTFAQSPGRISPDTKLDLTANPLRFLARAANLWNSDLPFGQAQNQAYGYLFPHGAFFLAGDLLGLPGWVTQRLWWALLLVVGFWGLLRVAEALGIGTPTSRVIAGVAFALSPRVLTTIGAISSETLPMMLAPWVLLPVILALRGTNTTSLRVLAARSAMAVALMGAVNAVATLTGCLAALIWWAAHRPNKLWWRFTAWWALCSVLAVTWWVVALVHARPDQPAVPGLHRILRRHHAVAVADRSAARYLQLDAVRRAECDGGTSLVTSSVAVLATTLVAAAGLVGLALRTMPARGRLITMLLVGLTLLAVGYSGGLGSPFAHQVQAFLDASGHAGAQRAQARAADPAAAGARPGPSVGPRPAAGQRAPAAVGERVRPSRTRQAGGRRHRRPRRARGGHVVGVDRQAHAARHVHGDPAVLARHRRLARRAQRGSGGRSGSRPGAGGARRPVRHPDVGQQSRRAAAGARRQPVGGARLDSADTAADHPRARLGAAPVRRRPARPLVSPIPLPGKASRMSWCATTWTRRRRVRHAPCWCTAPSTGRRG